jgi:hypothetical protein
VGAFEAVLPPKVIERSYPSGHELAIPYPDVLDAVQIASRECIAILGVETFEITPDGLQVVDYTGYSLNQ